MYKRHHKIILCAQDYSGRKWPISLFFFMYFVDSYNGWNLCLSGGVKTEY